MAVLRQRFSRPVPPRRGAIQSHIIGPFKGMNTSVPPQNLSPGETPYSENLILDSGILTPRPALVNFSTKTRPEDGGSTPHQYAKGYSVSGLNWHVVTSYTTPSAIISSESNSAWTTIDSNLSIVRAIASITSSHNWDIFYNADAKENSVAFANILTPPYHRPLDATSAWTSFTDFNSHESKADTVVSFDDRLIFGNTINTTEGTVSTRVRWSVRGDPLDFTSIGAGFEDLIAMNGPIIALVKEEDRLLIFSAREIWVARPRRDAYAFDFDLLDSIPGTIFRHTIQRTPVGVIWMDEDYNLYRLETNTIRTITPDNQNYIREVRKDQAANQQPWAQYNPKQNTYMLFFRSATLRSQAFFINVRDIKPDSIDPSKDKAHWMLQDFNNSDIWAGSEEHGRHGYEDVFPSVSYSPAIYNPLVKLDINSYTDPSITKMPFLWMSHGLRSSKDPTQFDAISDVLVDYSYMTSGTATFNVKFASKTTNSPNGFDESYERTVGFTQTDWFSSPAFYFANSGGTFMPQSATKFVPMTPIAGRYPQLMFYTAGEIGKPVARFRVNNLHLTLRPSSGRRPY